MNTTLHFKPRYLDQIAQVLKSLGHPQRLRIFEALATGERSVSQIQSEVDLPQAVVSQHLRIMKSGGVVRCRRDGTSALYQLAQPGLYNLFKCLCHCQTNCNVDAHA